MGRWAPEELRAGHDDRSLVTGHPDRTELWKNGRRSTQNAVFCSNPFAGTPECAYALCQRDEFATAMVHLRRAYAYCRHCGVVGCGGRHQDYQEFLDQFQGTIDVEYRDLNIVAGDTVAFSRGLERMTGTLKNGQKFDAWVRFTECYRKTNGHWLAIHDHISVPVDLESGKAALDLKP